MNDLATHSDVEHTCVRFDEGITLECGATLPSHTVAYRTYGTLNAAKTNAILICHALTLDQYVAETHPVTGKPGWWEQVVGPGCPVDTDRFFVICANILGGCMGSTGPLEAKPDGSGERWGTDFPAVTIRDMVRAQKQLIDHLGIERLFAVLGGSVGGMQALQWVVSYPNSVFAAVPIATAAFHSAQNIAFNEVGRQAIFADPNWANGQYWRTGKIPAQGLAVARMCAHITYLSEEALTRKFGRRLQNAPKDPSEAIALFGEMFEVESYLRHQGSTFVQRFDANSYLTITRAADYFDLFADTRVISRMHSAARRRGFYWRLSRPTGCIRRRKAAQSPARSIAPEPTCRSSSFRPTKGMTLSCSMSRTSTAPSPAFSAVAPSTPGLGLNYLAGSGPNVAETIRKVPAAGAGRIDNPASKSRLLLARLWAFVEGLVRDLSAMSAGQFRRPDLAARGQEPLAHMSAGGSSGASDSMFPRHIDPAAEQETVVEVALAHFAGRDRR